MIRAVSWYSNCYAGKIHLMDNQIDYFGYWYIAGVGPICIVLSLITATLALEQILSVGPKGLKHRTMLTPLNTC